MRTSKQERLRIGRQALSCEYFPLLAAFFTLIYVSYSHVEAATNLVDSSTVSFEAFLQHPPQIAMAIFEIQNFPPDNLGNSSVNTSEALKKGSIKSDGTNFIVDRVEVAPSGEWHHVTGRIGDVRWNYTRLTNETQGILREFDPKLGPETDGWLQLETLAKWPLHRLANLGMEEMIPGTVVWDNKDTNSFSAAFSRNMPGPRGRGRGPGNVPQRLSIQGNMRVQLHYKNGVPETANVQVNGQGDFPANLTYSVSYEYDPAFYDGRLPVMFTKIDSLGDKVFTARFRQLEMSREPLALSEFNPSELFKNHIGGTIVMSNAQPYSLERVLKMGDVNHK
jgi:hypothetical protein